MVLFRAARSLFRTPATTLACVATLAIGIASSTAIFTLIESLLLRPLPYPNPRELFAIGPAASWGDAVTFERHARSIAATGVYLKRTWGFTDDSHAPVEVVLAGMVTHGFFDALRVVPERGTTAFAPAMELPGANRVMWLTHDFWRRRYAANEASIGSTVRLNDVPYRVAGILPAGFRFPMDGANPDIYFPLDRGDYCCARDQRTLGGVARLTPGTTSTQAASELSALSGTRLELTDLQEALAGDRAQPLRLLGLASTLLMLVAGSNAAAILLARAARNLREAAIKASLGAGWKQLFGEQMAQGLAIAALAAVLGFGLSALALHTARAIPELAAALQGYERIDEIRMDARVAIVCILFSFLISVAAAMAPLAILRPRRLELWLRASPGSLPAVRARKVLVIAQIALSTVLLSSGGLVLAHLREVVDAPLGFRTDRVAIAGIGIPESRYDTDEKTIAFHERVLRNIERIPGISAAAAAGGMPLGGYETRFLPDGLDLPVKDRPCAAIAVVTPGIFRLLDIPLVEGRSFTSQDRHGHPRVALVNRRFVQRFGKSTGARIRVNWLNGEMKPWTEFQIIGVMEDSKNRSIDEPAEPAIYISALQVAMEGIVYFARTAHAVDAGTLTRDFRQAVWSVDKNLEAVRPRMLTSSVEAGLEPRRLAVWMVGGFGFLALGLATAGLAASVSASVTQNMKQIGIRMALGESSRHTARRIVAGSLQVTAWGLAVGIPGAALAARLVAHTLDGIGPLRILPLAEVCILTAFAGLAASLLPARRAVRIDPMEVLRRD